MNQDFYKRKFTKIELLTFSYNTVLQRLVDYKLDVEFYRQKARQYKKDSNDYNTAMTASLNAQTSLNNNVLTIEVIEMQLRNYEVDEKKEAKKTK